ncbi:MAG: hypothetical protein IJO52_06100 [Clostridia bacterium]|nr:hypothetical protein [Clostridia bacterium]
MDIKAKIEELVEKIKSDKALQKKFTEDPVSAVEQLIGIDLPNDQIEKIVDGIKAKITADDIGSLVGSILGKFKK